MLMKLRKIIMVSFVLDLISNKYLGKHVMTFIENWMENQKVQKI